MFQRISHLFRFIKNIYDITGLAATPYYRWKFFLLTTPFLILHRLGLRVPFTFFIRLRAFEQDFDFYITDLSDFFIIREIFFEHHYRLDLATEPKVVFDLGSNIGLSVIYFHLRYPKATIYGFEPDPKTFKKLLRNTKQFPQIVLHNIAISDHNGVTKFFVYPGRSMSSSLTQRLPDQIAIDVPTKTLDTLFQELNIDTVDLMKFDIEGGEYEVFKNFEGKTKVRFYIGEVHLNLMPVGKEEFLRFFDGLTTSVEDASECKFILRAHPYENTSPRI